MLVAVRLQLLVLTAAMTGDLSWTMAWSALSDVVTKHSRCFVPFLLIFSLIPSSLRNKTGISVGIALAITAYRTALGHAVSDGDFTLRELAQLLHLSLLAIWGGGVLIARLVVVPFMEQVRDSCFTKTEVLIDM